jgi:DNA-binding response OmpR family regulator
MPDNKLKILLVEDNDGDADLVQEYVDEVGQGTFLIKRGKTLAEGMAILASSYDPEVLLLDLNLPDSKGLNTLDAFCAKDVPGRSIPPIVVLTSLDDEDTATKALASCAQDYLVKQDISGKTLVRSIRNAVQRHGRAIVEEMLTDTMPDPADAIQVIRQVNRTGPGQFASATVKEDQAETNQMLTHQATALRAGEILFSQQEGRTHQIELKQERILADIDRINDKLKPLMRIAEGNGHGPLTSRLDALERILTAKEEHRKSETGFRKQIILGIIMLVLGGVGSLVVSLITQAIRAKS